MADGNNLLGLNLLSEAIQAQANRPQKTSQTTYSRPLELADMLARRQAIADKNTILQNALQARENFGYSLANALAGLPQQQGYGSWLGDATRAFGSAYAGRTDASIARAQKAIEDEQALIALDKAMGDQQVQEMAYSAPIVSSNAQGLPSNVVKTAQTAYLKLDPKLGKEFRDNPESFGYLAREADIGGRTPEGGSTGMFERAISSLAKGKVGDKALAKRGELLQKATQYVSAITDLAKQGGATGQMMNSDKEGQRAMAIFANPSAYSAEELGAAADSLVNLYDRMLTVAGMPTVEEGYNIVSQQVEQVKPQQEQAKSDPWAKYRTK